MTTIDLRTIPASTPSLCIPRVFANIGEARIRRIFDELNMGEIERVDIISKTTEKGEKFNRVFVHFKRWGIDGNAEKARQRLLNGQDIKIIYDDPWFWKISAYRPPVATSQSQPNKRPQQKAPRLELDDGPQRDDRPRENRGIPDNRLRGPDTYRDNRPRNDRPRNNRGIPDNRLRGPDTYRDNRPRSQRDNRARTPNVPPPREENDTYERPLDPHELAEQEETIRKNAEVSSQFGIQSEPALNKRAMALKNLLKGASKKTLTIETEDMNASAEEDEVKEA